MKAGLYKDICDNDILHLLRPLGNMGYRLDDDNVYRPISQGQGTETPWYHVKHGETQRCNLWHGIMWNMVIMPQLGEKFVPSPCQQCWKVVVRPQTLKQLFAILELQIIMDEPSKCGLEIRPSVFGLYGGYWYNTSIHEGLERYQQVYYAIKENEVLSPILEGLPPGETKKLLLKRGCTEFEAEIPDSLTWHVKPWQMNFEEEIAAHVDIPVGEGQCDAVKENVMRRWIEYAYQHGDITAFEYNDGLPFYDPYRTYHHLVNLSELDIEKQIAYGEKQGE